MSETQLLIQGISGNFWSPKYSLTTSQSLCCYCLPSLSLSALSCLTLCDPLDCSPPGPSVHGILQARVLEWVAVPPFRESSRPRDWTGFSSIAGRFFTTEPPGSPIWCWYITKCFKCSLPLVATGDWFQFPPHIKMCNTQVLWHSICRQPYHILLYNLNNL